MSLRRLLNRTILKSTKYEIAKADPRFKEYRELVSRNDSELKFSLEYIVAHRLLTSTDFFFVQVGANDGVSADPIYPLVKKYHLKGLALEPLPDVFSRLQETYADETQVICINKAIHADKKELQMFRIDPRIGGLPRTAGRIASFDKRVIDKHRDRIPGYDNHLMQEAVKCVTLHELLAEHHVDHINLLQIDTEGYDYEIIKMIDFEVMKPDIIRYEHKHLVDKDYRSSLDILMRNGYLIMQDGIDVTAYLRES